MKLKTGLGQMMKRSKRGSIQDIVVFLVTLFSIAVFATVMFKVGDGMQTAMLSSGLNTTNESINAINSLDHSAKLGDTLVGSAFIGLLLTLMISAILVPTNIIFTVIYLIIGSLLWFLSIPLSNAYVTMIGSASMAGMSGNLPLTYIIMSKLPLITTILLVMLIVILYGKRFLFTQDGGGAL